MTNDEKASAACPSRAMLPGTLKNLLVELQDRDDEIQKDQGVMWAKLTSRLDALEQAAGIGEPLTKEQADSLREATAKALDHSQGLQVPEVPE